MTFPGRDEAYVFLPDGPDARHVECRVVCQFVGGYVLGTISRYSSTNGNVTLKEMPKEWSVRAGMWFIHREDWSRVDPEESVVEDMARAIHEAEGAGQEFWPGWDSTDSACRAMLPLARAALAAYKRSRS